MSGGINSHMSDALGSTIGLVDSTGSINTSYTYEPFGNTTISGSSANPYQFTGRENDGTGLYYYRARYYSPTLQRFISQDPKEFVNSTNLYGYVTEDPTDIVDPTGEAFLDCGKQLLKLIDMLDVYKTKHNERMACPADCRDRGHKKRLKQLRNPLNEQIDRVRRACKNEFEALAQLAALENEYKNLTALLECTE